MSPDVVPNYPPLPPDPPTSNLEAARDIIGILFGALIRCVTGILVLAAIVALLFFAPVILTSRDFWIVVALLGFVYAIRAERN
jgi:hypothetical protein